VRQRCATLRVVAAAVAALTMVPVATMRAQAETARARRPAPAARRDRVTEAGSLVIPFTIGPPSCVDRARLYAVSMRIHNVLAQPVGIPALVDTAGNRLINNLRLSCGRYWARWNGRHMTTGRRLAPGTYLTELVIDGQRITRKVTLDR
jgi:hypothetical protein